MSEIISIDGAKTKIGLDSGKIVTVPTATLTYSSPKPGDKVKVYQEGEDIVVNPVKRVGSQGDRSINKVVYILVAGFLGFLGVHRFMRGQIGLGILYLLTRGLLSIGGLIDFIISLVKLGKYEEDYKFTSNGHWL